MKKYLIKGLLALVVGGFTASCADKDGDYVPVGQQKAAAYADAFKELIGGEVAPNHDWGFKKTSLIDESSQARANTRATIDVNGNEWASKPEVTAAEAKAVWRYVNMTLAQMRTNNHEYTTQAPTGLSTYYVTQVWGQASYSDYIETGKTDPNCIYSNFDKSQSGIVGPQHMDELKIAMSAPVSINGTNTVGDWEHINNFNATGNTNYGGNTGVIGGGTLDFVYRSSEDSKFHNKWIIIDGKNITDETGVTHTGKYYVCFDFYSCTDQCYTNCSFRDSNNTPHNGQIEGAWNSLDEAAEAKAVVTYWEWNGSENVERKTTIYAQGTSDWQKSNVNQGNMCIPANNIYTDWIIRLVNANPGDDVTGGETSNTTTTTRKDRVERSRLVRQGRIFCEDLGTNADKISKSDIDFNDAVFDAKIWRKGQFDVQYLNDTYNSESEYLEGIYTNGINQTTGIDYNVETEDVIVNGKFKYVAEICLLAAGGTVPLKIGGDKEGFEIHDKFGKGQKSPRTISHTTIINTVGAPSQEQFTTTVSTDVCDAVTVEVDITDLVKAAIEKGNTDIGLDIIPIDVEWVSGNHQSVGELSSEYGQAPQKLCVPIGTPWVYERIPITTAYKDFKEYAKDYSPSNPLTFWDLVKNTIDTNYLYANGPEGMTAETGESGNIGSNPFYDEVIIKGPTTTTTEVETVLWEGEMTFGANDANQTIKLYSTTFDADNDIRIYGSSNDGQLTLQNSDSQNIISPSLNFSNVGYADSSVDESQAGQLSSGPSIIVVASNCTITKICKVVKTTTTK